MSLLAARRSRQSAATKEQGRLITIECNNDTLKLEDRYELLMYTFLKQLQGGILRRIIRFDLCNGVISGVVGGGPAIPGPTGTVKVTVEEVSGVTVTEEPVDLKKVS